jgi:HSP20 family protein
MDIDFKKLAPWNWFKKEQEEQQSTASLPVQRNDLPVAGGPVSPILQLHREIDRLFDDAFRGFGFPTLAMPRWPSDWPGMLKPALDIQETDKQYKIALEVPGVEEKDIQITLDNDVLLVRGEKRQEQETKDGGFHRVERSYGSFQRALNLPADANQDTIKAAFKNGVLTITMESARPVRPSRGARSRSTADAGQRFLKNHKEMRHRDRRCLVRSIFTGASAWPENNAKSAASPPRCGWKPISMVATAPCCCVTITIANWCASKSAPSRRWKPCLARAAAVRRLPRQRLLPHR